MLYDVPQTDSTSEAAMAALVLRLRASQAKPDAITAGAATDGALALLLCEWIGKINSALHDGKGDDPIIVWDGALDGVCRKLAARDWYNLRGRNRQAGADEGIDQVAEAAEAYLARCRPGGDGNGKTEQPFFQTTTGAVKDGGIFKSSPRSDSWICGSGAHR